MEAEQGMEKQSLLSEIKSLFKVLVRFQYFRFLFSHSDASGLNFGKQILSDVEDALSRSIAGKAFG